MNPLNLILVAIIALLGYPAGLLIAKLTREELRAGRKWFKLIVFTSVIAIIISVLFATGEALIFLASSFIFILLLALAALTYPKLKIIKKNDKTQSL